MRSDTVGGRDRQATGLALGLLSVALVLVAATVGLYIAASSRIDYSSTEIRDGTVFFVAGLATPVLGALLARRRPSNPIGWLFLAGGAAGAYGAFAAAYAEHSLVAHPGALPGGEWVLWSGALGLAAFYLPAVFALFVFPDGHLLSPRWRSVCWVAAVAVVVELLGQMLRPGPIPYFDRADIDNPAGIDGAGDAINVGRAVAGVVAGLALLAAIVSLVVRYRGSSPRERRQVAFFGLAVGALVVLAVAGNTVGGGYGANVVLTVATDMMLMVGLPAALAAAVLWRGLYDIERVVSRRVLHWMWRAILIGIGALLALGVGVTVADRWSAGVAVLCAVVVTISFEPIRRAIERFSDRVVFGPSGRGYELAVDFGATVDRVGDVGELAGRLAELVCRGLDTRWARATLLVGTDDEAIGECVAPRVRALDGEPVIAVPIAHRNEQVGVIECGAKLEGEFRDHDLRLLELLAKEAALAAHALRLASSLAASRSRIVAAQEAERRRIERNIHDGAQQDLVALIAKVRLARDLLSREPEKAAATMEEVQRDARFALREIRELAQGIHPTVLADQGVVQAIEDRTARLPFDVRVSSDAITRSARYDDAVEGAAFFVVSEALTNVLKHARATTASVSLAQNNGTLEVEVRDDGRGFVRTADSGSGLVALADRVEALGGALEVDGSPGTGTVLRARIPAQPPTRRQESPGV